MPRSLDLVVTSVATQLMEVQLITGGFVRSAADAIEEFGIDGGSVCPQITERAVVHDIGVTRKTLSELKEVGVPIAIEDFGRLRHRLCRAVGPEVSSGRHARENGLNN